MPTHCTQEAGEGHPKEGVRSSEQLVSRMEGAKDIAPRATGAEASLNYVWLPSGLMKIHCHSKNNLGTQQTCLGLPEEVEAELT